MGASRFASFMASVIAAGALLAGCGGNPAGLTPPAQGTTAMRIASPAGRDWIVRPTGMQPPSARRSWMAPEAAKQQLLYVSDQTANVVFVFSYPSDNLMGTLAGFNLPQGVCADGAGNVFVVDAGNERVREYAHGSITPKATLPDPGYIGASCAIDPTTGNLAVGNFQGTGSAKGNVAIYKGAAGSPVAYYSAPSLAQVFFCDFDASGNLWVDGMSPSEFDLAELKAGKKTFTHIFVNQPIGRAGNVLWVGKYLVLGDLTTNVVNRFLVNGDKATSVGGVTLTGVMEPIEFAVQSGRIIVPDVSNGAVGIFKYPAGGTVLKTLTGFTEPFGAVISATK